MIRRLRANKQAVAITEFALATPLVLTVGLAGLETGNLAITSMRVNQAAMHIADNASRIGDTSTLANRKIYESDLNDLLLGSNLQAGENIDLYEYGRVILSSLQVVPGSDPQQQYIAWQRCKGRKTSPSTYGDEGTGKDDPSFVGMGPKDQEVFAMEGEPVMFVEVAYDYQPIVTDAFLSDTTIRATSAFQVRASRDLTEIYQKDPDSPDDIARCDIYDSYKEIPPPPRKTGSWSWLFSDDPDATGLPGSSGIVSSGSSGVGSSGVTIGATSTGGPGTTTTTTSGGGAGIGTTSGGGPGTTTTTTSGGNSGNIDNGNGEWCPTWGWWC
ncbi:hypothetical protein GCM10023115_17040 [Pontixanthobacter gangjinensis]